MTPWATESTWCIHSGKGSTVLKVNLAPDLSSSGTGSTPCVEPSCEPPVKMGKTLGRCQVSQLVPVKILTASGWLGNFAEPLRRPCVRTLCHNSSCDGGTTGILITIDQSRRHTNFILTHTELVYPLSKG